jgi:hypothetical protein
MAESEAPRANPHLKDLAFLVGDWEMELSNAAFLPQALIQLALEERIESTKEGRIRIKPQR